VLTLSEISQERGSLAGSNAVYGSYNLVTWTGLAGAARDRAAFSRPPGGCFERRLLGYVTQSPSVQRAREELRQVDLQRWHVDVRCQRNTSAITAGIPSEGVQQSTSRASGSTIQYSGMRSLW
jgi:hypothetical protein